MKKQIKNNETIIAKVAIMGAKRGCGWRYTKYQADKNLKSGYRFVGVVSGGMYPNKVNYDYSDRLEKRCTEQNIIVVDGRPIAGANAPIIE